MKRWTETHARGSNIVDYEEFNEEYNAHKSTLNGGIDRNQLPQNAVTKSRIKDNAMHGVYLNTHGEFKTAEFTDTATAANTEKEFRGLTYSTYNGGWIDILSQSYTGLKDGVAYIEFSSHLHINTYFNMANGSTINNKGVQFAIEWNGVPLVNTYDFTLGYQTVRLIANTFIAGGSGKLVIKARMTPKGPSDYLHSVQMHFWGMRTLLIGRWR